MPRLIGKIQGFPWSLHKKKSKQICPFSSDACAAIGVGPVGDELADNATMDSKAAAPEVVARRVRVRGVVQGVGFRAACMRHAMAHGIVGWVRNRGDGSVEALLLGVPQALDRMCAWVREGVPGARVTGVEVEPAPLPDPAPERFELLPTC
jgi:acylphosphatase